MIAHDPHVSGKSSAEPLFVGYYDIPVIHGPHWKWLVIGYFYFGGISGASAVIAGFLRFCGGPSGAAIARLATYVSFLTLLPCPVLLIFDLGRPARFINMLRTFRVSSPMSVGSWGLAMFGGIMTLATGLQVLEDRSSRNGKRCVGPPRAVGDALSLLGGISGFVVAGYTGVLLAATAVPLWSKRSALLGPLFLSSAMTSGVAAISAVSSGMERKEGEAHDRLRMLETISTVTEEALLVTWIAALGSTAGPITDGRLGAVVRYGAVGAGMVLPLMGAAFSPYLPRQFRRPERIVSAALTLAGVFVVRCAVVMGGRRSADDPGATFEMTG